MSYSLYNQNNIHKRSNKNEQENLTDNYDQESGNYYENGILINSGSLTKPTAGNDNLYLSYRSGTNYYFNGKISNIQIYNRALSASEVLQNYNALKGRFNL